MKNTHIINRIIILLLIIPTISNAQFFFSLEDRLTCNLSDKESERFEELSAPDCRCLQQRYHTLI